MRAAGRRRHGLPHFPEPRDISPPPFEALAPHFPDLEILELIGAGGMGAVYKARQAKYDRLSH